MVTIEAFPQIQEIKIYLKNGINGNRELQEKGIGDDLNSCASFNLNVTLNGDILGTISLRLNMSQEETQRAINNLETTQNIGKIVVTKNNNTFSTSFIMLSIANSSDSLPELKLDSESVECFNSTSSSNYSLALSMITLQNATFPKGFTIGFNSHDQSQRFTPELPLTVSRANFEKEMNDLLKWTCDYPTPSSNLSILYSTSFEGNDSEADNSTAFCGRQSKRNPKMVWEDSDGLGNHDQVRNPKFTCPIYNCFFFFLF